MCGALVPGTRAHVPPPPRHLSSITQYHYNYNPQYATNTLHLPPCVLMLGVVWSVSQLDTTTN